MGVSEYRSTPGQNPWRSELRDPSSEFYTGASMKKLIIIIFAVLLGLCSMLAADVDPATATVNCLRGSEVTDISSETYYTDSSLMITGTIYNAATTNGAVQDLTDVDIEVKFGNVAQGSNIYTGTVSDATSGTFYVTGTIPTNKSPVYIQYKITDTNSTSYIFPWHNVKVKDAM